VWFLILFLLITLSCVVLSSYILRVGGWVGLSWMCLTFCSITMEHNVYVNTGNDSSISVYNNLIFCDYINALDCIMKLFINPECYWLLTKHKGLFRDLNKIRFEFESAVRLDSIRKWLAASKKFSNRIGRACQLLIVSLVKRLKPLTALSGTVYRLAIALWAIIRWWFNVLEDCNEEFVVSLISFASFVITDSSNLYSLELKRFDSKIRFEHKWTICRSLGLFYYAM